MALQDSAGWWKAELETNVTMDAEDLLLREFLGIGDAAAIGRAANWIRSQQREDGSWANFYGAPANLSTTVEAYAALRLAGDEPEAPHMAARARVGPAPPAASRTRASSPISGSRSSASGSGTTSPRCRPS